MAIRKRVWPEDIGRSMGAILAGAGTSVEGLWMTTRRDVITFWVLTPPIEIDTQLELYDRSAALYDEFPGIKFEVHVLNPTWFAAGDTLGALPADAHPISLTAA